MSASASTVLMPDAEPAWKLWRGLSSGKPEKIDSPSDCQEGARSMLIGLPATACRSIGLMLPAAESSLLPAMIEAQLEKRGITVRHDPAPNFAWHLLGQDAVHSIVSVDVLAEPFPEPLAINHAGNYTAALRLLALPPRELVLIEEQGQLVLAASHQGKLWHSHLIGPADLNVVNLARELEITRLSLESVDGFGLIQGITLVGERLAQLKPILKKQTGLNIETAGFLPPNRELDVGSFQKLLPASVFEAQTSRARRARILSIAFLVAACYCAAFAAGWWYLNSLQKRADLLKDEVAKTIDPANEVQNTSAHWRSMEPAIDTQRYPMVQLSLITALMPPSGVLIRKFDAKPNEIEMAGDARDAQTATQFLEDLKGSSKLNRFAWSMPVPSVKDRVAAFKIQGRLNVR